MCTVGLQNVLLAVAPLLKPEALGHSFELMTLTLCSGYDENGEYVFVSFAGICSRSTPQRQRLAAWSTPCGRVLHLWQGCYRAQHAELSALVLFILVGGLEQPPDIAVLPYVACVILLPLLRWYLLLSGCYGCYRDLLWV